jgi:hypothetical protein
LRSAPADQKKGSNWKLPSSVAAAENAIPLREPEVRVLASALSWAQVVGGVRPAFVNRS